MPFLARVLHLVLHGRHPLLRHTKGHVQHCVDERGLLIRIGGHLEDALPCQSERDPGHAAEKDVQGLPRAAQLRLRACRAYSLAASCP